MARSRAPQDAVVVEEVMCAFCGGRGIDPFGIMSSLSRCCVCGGSGKVLVQVPHIPCAHCRATGAIKTLTCTVCAGKGVVPRPALPLVPCPICLGTGDDATAPAMGCLRCRGKGRVTGPQLPSGLEVAAVQRLRAGADGGPRAARRARRQE
jgi:DnaJ-class molecular chaperone